MARVRFPAVAAGCFVHIAAVCVQPLCVLNLLQSVWIPMVSGRSVKLMMTELCLVSSGWSVTLTPTEVLLPRDCHVLVDTRWGPAYVAVTYCYVTWDCPPFIGKTREGVVKPWQAYESMQGADRQIWCRNIVLLKIVLKPTDKTQTPQYEFWMLQKGMEAWNCVARDMRPLLLFRTCCRFLLP
jgi:hypothetical protein